MLRRIIVAIGTKQTCRSVNRMSAFGGKADLDGRVAATSQSRKGGRKVTIWRLLQVIGAGCLVVVVLTHVAEAFKLFPVMGWGLPTSPGHYLDLISAVLGCTLLPLGFLGNLLARRENSN